MKSLKALIAYLDGLRLYDRDQFDSWAETGTLEWRNTPLSGVEDIRILYTLPYIAVLSIEDFTGSADELFFYILSWLTEQCYDFDDLGRPSFDAEMTTDDKVDIEISIHFEDDVIGTEDANGKLLMDGKHYSIVNEKFEPAIVTELAGVQVD